MSQVFKSPAAYVQGQGVTREIGTHDEGLDEEALLLADEVVLKILEDCVLTSLRDAGLGATSVEFNRETSRRRSLEKARPRARVGVDLERPHRDSDLRGPRPRRPRPLEILAPRVLQTDADAPRCRPRGFHLRARGRPPRERPRTRLLLVVSEHHLYPERLTGRHPV